MQTAFPAAPRAPLEHIRWRRLPDAPPRRTRPNQGGERPPLRSDAAGHGEALAGQLASTLIEGEASREQAGVDPARLRILELGFLYASERVILEKLGLQVLAEEEIAEPVEPPYYRIELRFNEPEALTAFAAGDHSARGVTGIDPVRASSGAADRSRLACRFASRPDAIAFKRDEAYGTGAGFVARQPAKVSHVKRHRLLAQFPDQTTIEAFERELERYRAGVAEQGELTAIERRQLFDALEEVSAVGPGHRRGERLSTEPVPDGRFYVDVDLWHPGLADLAHEAARQFEAVVEAAGGRVTDGPKTVAQTLLLARVQIDASALDSLLRYDRVAQVDLPPRPYRPEFTPFTPLTVPEALSPVPDDGPLACVIDSGVVAGHPLLRGVVVEERDFDSGEGTAVDTVGHGTHTAGIVVYGDLHPHVATGDWRPQVRLLSAKVLRRAEMGDGAEFSDEKHAVTQLQDAIAYFARERGCRVFNLSIGHDRRRYLGGRQLPWALALDELARDLDVVIVVSAGNVARPGIPTPFVADQFQPEMREQLLSPEHALIDPASAALALTVGSIARGAAPHDTLGFAGRRPQLAGAPAECPSPFTRTGLLDGSGPGLRRAVKPELVDYGGNYRLDDTQRGWSRSDPQLGELSLNHDFQTGRPLAAQSGTSAAAPYVAHCCAVVEAQLRRQAADGRPPSANLVRALAVHAARHSDTLRDWMAEGSGPGDAATRLLRVAGYGQTDPARAAFSADNRAVLIAEDEVREDHFHLYELELPDEFATRAGRRRVRITLAYDPPIRGTRREYLSRTMWFQAYRGLPAGQIVAAMGRASGTGEAPDLPGANVVHPRPPYTQLQWSTVQSAVFDGSQNQTFNYRAEPDGPRLLHVLVGCTRRFDAATTLEQRYALVTSLEHEDETVQLYQTVRQRIEQRALQRVRLTR